MTRSSKLVAVALAAALLAQPLWAASACWQDMAAVAACAGCPMSHQAPPTNPVKVQSNHPGCCEIGSSEPSPSSALPKASQTTPVALVLPTSAPASRVEAVAAPVLASVSPPRTFAASLQTLYCVFLI